MNKRISILLTMCTLLSGVLCAHPLGIFSTNRYARLELAVDAVRIVYVMDMAEIPSVQEITSIDLNKDGVFDQNEQALYSERKIPELLKGLALTIDGKGAFLKPGSSQLSFPEGQGGLKTTRLSLIIDAPFTSKAGSHVLQFTDSNFLSSRGWKEITVRETRGEKILQSTASRNDVTDELRSYPPEMISSPLNMTEASIEFTDSDGPAALLHGSLPQSVVQKAGDGFAELISARELSTPVMIISLLLAMVLGAGHALTPGHGKTVVAAYLVGSRGTAKHAAFLGFTVTATHTIGVFVMGLIALFASQYILPEQLYPWLSTISGILVVGIGVSLFTKRLRLARRGTITGSAAHNHDGHSHTHDDRHHHGHAHTHTHDGHTHSHLPSGADGSPVTWKSLLALGISGGILPCPSAVVVLLGAVALGRIGFGLLLIVAFSVGLAGVLTGIGLLMVYARSFFERFKTQGMLLRWLPVGSALVVTVAGLIISIQALGQAGVHIPSGIMNIPIPSRESFAVGTLSILGLGFILGLKHALDADHLVAVSTIVSERKGFLSSSIIGGFWGLGHTASLLIVGLVVIALHVQIPEKVALAMEFTVAAMLVSLGANVLWKLRRGGWLHMHPHEHADHIHVHPHVHAHEHAHDAAQVHSHHRISHGWPGKTMTGLFHKGKRSLFIGMVHGLAGSAALMLIVLATIPTTTMGLLYIGIFGVGSIGGMLIMSTIIGIPFVVTAHKSDRLNAIVRGLSGTISLGFGLFLAYQIGFMDGLFLR